MMAEPARRLCLSQERGFQDRFRSRNSGRGHWEGCDLLRRWVRDRLGNQKVSDQLELNKPAPKTLSNRKAILQDLYGYRGRRSACPGKRRACPTEIKRDDKSIMTTRTVP